MKKSILSLITVMVLGATVSYATSTGLTTSSAARHHDGDDKTEMRHHDGDHKGGPHRPPMGPRIQATEGCKCATCEQIRKMEAEMQQRMKEHKEHMDKKGCPGDSCECKK